jgi:hypothetical protein
VDQQDEKERERASKKSAEAFHWAWSHNILQIKGNQTVYQKKGYIMMSRSIVNMKKGRTSIMQRSFLQQINIFLNNEQ